MLFSRHIDLAENSNRYFLKVDNINHFLHIVKWFHVFLSNSYSCIWSPVNGFNYYNLAPENNVNKGVFHITQTPRFESYNQTQLNVILKT